MKKLQRAEATGQPLRIKLGLDPTAPDIHFSRTVVHEQDAPEAPGPGAHGDLPDRRLHQPDRRSVGPQHHPAAAHGQQIRANAETYFAQAKLVLDRQIKTELQLQMERPAGRARHDPAGRQVRCGPHDGATTTSTSASRPASRLRPRIPLPADAGLRLRWRSRATSSSAAPTRSSTCWWAGTCSRVRPGAAVHPDHAAAGGLDGVEMSKSKNSYIGIGEDANTMFAKTLSISDEADVEVVHAAVLPLAGGSRRAEGRGGGRAQPPRTPDCCWPRS